MNLTDVVSELDKQIGRLQQARTILMGGVQGAILRTTTVSGGRRGPRRMSAAARRRISEAQRARWAKVKGGQNQKTSPATPIDVKHSKQKSNISAEGRARIAAAQKKRWSKTRKAAA